ncbi:nuclease-related domain-containing protein [Halobacillus rhizosphaerae]|uniref:NERD domain-containing protein n=1 Tax=Halobacillus rhizosphaerae TaxID=3064889 RepID=UPI00398ABCD8
MIVKKLEFPQEIQQLQALVRRLNPSHPSYEEANENLTRRLAGYKGELSLSYPLSFLPSNHLIFHDLRLTDGSHFFQIDALILTSKWILIIEAKNIAGRLHFDQHFNQLLRTLNEAQEAFANPVIQVRRHKLQLAKWLSHHHLPSLPILTLVASSNPRSILSSDDPELDIVVRTDNLPEKINELTSQFSEEHLTEEQIHLLTSALLTKHTPGNFIFLSQLKINPLDIRRGVFCEECSRLPMNRKRGYWKCMKCGHRSRIAHEIAIRDYYLLFGPEITNAKLRDFLLIDSIYIASRILTSLKARRSGKNKGSCYQLIYED